MSGVLSSNPDRKSHSIPADMKQEIKEMFEEGLNIPNISRYMGVSISTVRNIVEPYKLKATRKEYYLRNREKIIARMKAYQKERKEKVAELDEYQLAKLAEFKSKLI